MQPEELIKHLAVIANACGAAIRSEPAAREAVRQIGQWLLHLSDPDRMHALPPEAAEGDPVEMVQTSSPDAATPEPDLPLQSVELTIAGVRQLLQVPGTAEQAQAAQAAAHHAGPVPGQPGERPVSFRSIAADQIPDIKMIATRCRVKAEGCEWAARYRDHWDEQPADVMARKERYASIISRARELPHCYVWALNPNLNIPGFQRMSEYAGAYRNLAAAAELADQICQRQLTGEWRAGIFQLLAEAQSALRAALESDSLFADLDQEQAFHWLRARTTQDRVLLVRHMKLDDPADVADHADLTTRLIDFRTRLSAHEQHTGRKRELLNKARYHASLLREAKSIDEHGDWRRIISAIQMAIELGTPPSDVAIRDVLVPIVEQLPDDLELPAGFERVIESLDQYLTTRETAGESEPRQRAITAEVAEAAQLLRDEVVVLIGGKVRPRSKEALERDLCLKELRWIEGAHHQSHYLFEAAIARPETCVVIVAIRWSSHSFERVDELCSKYGKLYVRLPGGYSSNQVARQILTQVGRQLRSIRAQQPAPGQ